MRFDSRAHRVGCCGCNGSRDGNTSSSSTTADTVSPCHGMRFDSRAQKKKECARCLEIYGTKWVTRFVEHQIDERDGGIVRTHVYLIFGFGLSIFFRHRSELVMSRPTPFPLVMACDLIPGLIGLGVVDAMAAVMGTRAAAARKVALKTPKNSVAPTTLASVLCGKWFSGLENAAMQRKTVTGCCWGFLCGSLIWVLILLGLFGPVVLMSRWLWVGIGSIAAATWWEGVCNGVDNLELPLFVYATVMAIGTFGLRA
ncbi:dolichol kinase, putative [Bodo saltans]|uniref:dolichol kinase n=1 Tax=Bodo saltans TaxID=75058 RepID=A0A0S4KN70_BODSA|nr:dolichol kinase, putative [Bodo saltans]|eukprot:CUI15055.1 dolichol kinase, putative [Bodo saltans]